ncbi:hypothetical protein ABB37_08028 [Leptomonas pyrrhocoris]|uniref:Uncharacterized protein n=1 Tax=Leptomonas pyrrhocoris TaxID=157538 RepID=A0A0M9FUT1_LEPPY|nr:hypothetical protein ABB37_08028 [Leptomonas pyrrhocoris]XP_015654746.1 hypothetical protein ABB37_08028 [Leptomonas pyrrhocoris]KPA76306.1 hypothetical protein ABB37_08028 [Leptomonas pyrrhocoris]KPA76307.1 hypothetical protein ABB37_08028 [Leptomonas pyrrhocoris]|eukprot:XP_015654745.1 hypothetical protein ABB37_08028 [Leptomonas pyrrhocoris]
MLLCREDTGGAPSVKVLLPFPPVDDDLFRKQTSSETIFERLHRLSPPSLSRPAFEAVVSRARQEESVCTFAPQVNHTHDDVLRLWSANSSVFDRLYGNAQCQQEQQSHRSDARPQRDVEEDERFHQRFRAYTFPSHLYSFPTPSRNRRDCENRYNMRGRGRYSESPQGRPSRRSTCVGEKRENGLHHRRRGYSHIASPLSAPVPHHRNNASPSRHI